ncbi:poly(A)-binding protein binding protein, partial [Coemansia spiralis]
GEAADEADSMHSRLLFLLAYLVGAQVAVTTTGGDVYRGVLWSINPNDAQSVVLRYAQLQHGGKAAQPVDTLVINGSDCLCISGVAAVGEDGGAGGSGSDHSRTGFRTDTDISRAGGAGAARELHRWVPDSSDDVNVLESDGLAEPAGRSWDQFAANERLFGLTTDFDEEIYTTKLDRTRADYKQREREAIRIAHEIQSTPFLNSHVAEERQDVAPDGGDSGGGAMDEEDKYGAVLRPSGAPGKYVPPYMRGKTDHPPAGHERPAPVSRQNSASPPAADQPQQQPNNAMAAAALAKLNIRTTGHSPAPSSGGAATPTSHASPQLPAAAAVAASRAGAPGPAADPAITAASKPGGGTAGGKLAGLRGNKHRTDAAAVNKPMADITEKLKEHKRAMRKDTTSNLRMFSDTLKLPTPMPDDVAEMVGAKKKSKKGESPPPPAAPVTTAAPAKEAKTQSPPPPVVDAPPATKQAPIDAASKQQPRKRPGSGSSPGNDAKPAATAVTPAKPAPKDEPPVPATKDVPPAQAPKDEPLAPANEPKKSAFKFNAKASTFKPSATAAPFVPKFGATSSRAPSAAAVGPGEQNPFFGRRPLKRAPLPLWGGAFKLAAATDRDDAPTWPFGSRTYQSQFVVDGPDAMMYPPHGYMPPYAYGYYQYPPQMAMGLPAPGTRVAASSPYAAPLYASGPYTAAPGYPSPILAATARSPVPVPSNGPSASPLPRAHANTTQHTAATPDLGPAILSGQSGRDSPGLMYGTPPLHMGMVPPMPFGGMHAGGYLGPSVPPPQGYPPQSVPMPMAYYHPPAQPYETSPPMILMHTSPHPEHSTPPTIHHPPL